MIRKIEFDIVEGSMIHPNAGITLKTYTFKGNGFEEFTLASEVELDKETLEGICLNQLVQDGICDQNGYCESADIIDFPCEPIDPLLV